MQLRGITPTVRNYISINWMFDGHLTVEDLEEAELVEDVAMICGMVRDGVLIDEYDELGENVALLEELWQQE